MGVATDYAEEYPDAPYIWRQNINNDLEINIIDVVLLINFILYNDISFSNIDCIADIDENNLINVFL